MRTKTFGAANEFHYKYKQQRQEESVLKTNKTHKESLKLRVKISLLAQPKYHKQAGHIELIAGPACEADGGLHCVRLAQGK